MREWSSSSRLSRVVGRTTLAIALALAGVAACADAAPGDGDGASRTARPSGDDVPESTTVSAGRATGADSGATRGGTRVLIIGTSLTAGLGLDPDSAYPAVMDRLADSAGFDIDVQAAGLSGETSAGALRRVDWLLRDRADVVIIETGANDGLRGLDPDTTQANIIGIIERVRAANPEVKVLLAQMEAPPNLGARYTREFRDVFMTVAREHQVTLVPFFLEGVAGDPTLNQGDGIHPNEEGARRAARNMWSVLAPVLAQSRGAYDR